jgi:hypothetical protein
MPQIVLAATQAAALAPAVAPAVIAPAATGLGAAAANTAAIELAKQKAIEAGTQQLGQQVAQQATQQVGQQAAQQATQQATQQLGQQAANQGIAQASQQATQQLGQQALTQTGQEAAVEAAKQTGVEGMKQGIFSANPAGMPPTAGPITPTGPLNPATPLPPAGGTPPMTLEQQLAQIQANPTDLSKFPQYEQVATAGSNTPLVEKAAGPVDPTKNPFAPFKSNVPVRENMLAYKEALPNFQTAQNAKLQAQISNLDGGLGSEFLKNVPVEQPSALKKGVMEGLEIVKKYPAEIGMASLAAGQYMNKPEKEDEDKYKNTVDMSEFKASEPVQRPFTPSYEYQSYQGGGPVEDMSRMNSIGANTGFPMARLQTPAYAVSSATPMPVNTLTPSADASVNAYTGEPRFAEGGLSEAQRREYGLQTRSQRAARGLTKTFEEMEEERQKEAMKLFGERTDPGIVPRSRTQMLSSPFSAAQAEHARLGKKTKVPVIPMPKTNLGDIDNYMDIPIEAAQGGIMHGLGGYSDGGRLLKGPGDGVSDSIPAVIGKRQPARLADGEFVIPARIVSELGNGSTEAGARKLYAMMERVQASRKKSIGKKKVAVNSKADKHLPA